MKPIRTHDFFKQIVICALLAAAAAVQALADDTDIYKPKVKHNVMIVLDNSSSMDFGVYDNDVDYHEFYQYISEDRTDWTNSGDFVAGRYDPRRGIDTRYGTNAYFYPDARASIRNRIYLVRGDLGYANGMTGDAGDPQYLWYGSSMIDTGTNLNADGELVDAEGDSPGDVDYGGRVSTVTVDGKVYVTLDGTVLPNSRDILLHDWQENPDGSRIDKGFSGMLRAPGTYFSGYFYNNATDAIDTDPANAQVLNDRKVVYFFITGNWMNMQTVYNLQVEVGNSWVDAWSYCTFPKENYTPTVDYGLSSPNYPGNYAANYDSQQDGTVNYLIYNGESEKMRLHFDAFTLAAGDQIELYDQNGDKVATLTSNPTDGWTAWVTGNQILVRFITDNDAGTVDTGWHINAYQYQSKSDYDFFSRLEVAADAMIDVVEATRGKVNWGYTTFNYSGNQNTGYSGDGAKMPAELPLNPSFNDDLHKQAVINQLEKTRDDGGVAGGTPLGEALQDMFLYFQDKENQVYRACNKNFVIVLTDGFPTDDDDWDRLGSAYNFDTDGSLHDASPHQYVQDPFAYSSPPNDYYDDVAGYLYTHAWVDTDASGTDRDPHDLIPESERADTPDNIVVHSIGFTVDSAMLEHAADLGGGIYLTAYNKAQLVSVFYSLGLLIAEYSSYTAPVVSVDEANRVQSGDRLYMALFKPNETQEWTGNLKKYGLQWGVQSTCGREAEWYVVDKTGKEATECDGTMLQETSSFWSTVNDGGEVELGGAGGLIYNAVPANIGLLDSGEVTSANFRTIKTSLDGTNLITVATDTLTNANLGVSDDEDRYKIVNFLYGYAYDAHDATSAASAGGLAETGSPVIKRWPLGPIVHSEPILVDYLNNDGSLNKRYIAVGANDGMLHVFDDSDGSEIYAFVPPAVLTVLKQYDPTNTQKKVYTVDGPPVIVKKSGGDRLLVFGLRRGGRAYYALNITNTSPANWSLEWVIEPSTDCGSGDTCFAELGQSWSRMVQTRIQTGANAYKNVLIFGGGYDAGEDRSDENDYTLSDSHASAMGRGIFIIDTDTGLPVADALFNGADPFVWPADDSPASPIDQMKYCFPADPTVVTDYGGLMLAAYLSDLYGQVWKVRYEYDENAGTGKFYLNLIFKANPMYNQFSAYENRTDFTGYEEGDADPRPATVAIQLDNQDNIVNPRRTYYSPDVSYAGNEYTDVPVLYLGTGDREHPTFIGSMQNAARDYKVRNGLFSFYDAQAYSEQVLNTTYNDANYFKVPDLLNVTCGALEPDVTQVTAAEKSDIEAFLKYGAMGWYILFHYDQSNCPHQDGEDHSGEKAIAPVNLFAKTVFAPTFTPAGSSSNNDACVYEGTARVFAVNYSTGNAALNFYEANDTEDDPNTTEEDESAEQFTRLDRYKKIGTHIPSGVSIVIRHGKPAGFVSVGGKIAPVPGIEGPSGMIPFYWREIFR